MEDLPLEELQRSASGVVDRLRVFFGLFSGGAVAVEAEGQDMGGRKCTRIACV